jgi:hypothetical protein
MRVALAFVLAGCAAPPQPEEPDAAPPPPACTSGVHVDANRQPGKDMMPGHACIACHAAENAASGEQDAPIFAFAGTVYPTAHEPDLCAGAAAAGAEVVVVDARGERFVAVVNGVGNFHLDGEVVPPFHASVRLAGRERAMQHAESNGDCNGCHRPGAVPGRIVLP